MPLFSVRLFAVAFKRLSLGDHLLLAEGLHQSPIYGFPLCLLTARRLVFLTSSNLTRLSCVSAPSGQRWVSGQGDAVFPKAPGPSSGIRLSPSLRSGVLCGPAVRRLWDDTQRLLAKETWENTTLGSANGREKSSREGCGGASWRFVQVK